MAYGTFAKALDGAEAAVPKQEADEQTPVLLAARAGKEVTQTTTNTTRSFSSPSLLVVVAVLGLAACGVALAFGGSTATAGAGLVSFSSLGEEQNFRAFLCYFSPEADARHMFNPGDYENVKLALASSKNFGAPVDLVTTGDDKEIREALSDESVFGHVNVVNMELCGENDAMPAFQCPGGFVDIIEQLKAAYVAAHPGESVAYFEADMVIQPGAGDVVRKALAENDFDVGYTYQPDFMTAFYDAACGPACGSLNSGFILWKNVKTATNEWNNAVISALYGMGSSFNGGENQAATDAVVAQRQLPPWTVVELADRNMKVLSLPYETYNFVFAPDMGDGTDPETACCTQKANPILHFYSGYKPHQLSKCCKDLVYGS